MRLLEVLVQSVLSVRRPLFFLALLKAYLHPPTFHLPLAIHTGQLIESDSGSIRVWSDSGLRL